MAPPPVALSGRGDVASEAVDQPGIDLRQQLVDEGLHVTLGDPA